ncbi:MAG: Calx-beta domain-containing protein [Cyanobacteriota bacterium]|nr:Calx-beta domain-containing protein [Cyanobacteriota bacterium]
MVLTPNPEFGFITGDESSEVITLTPGQLNGFPNGLLALGGNDTVQGSSDAELVIGNQGIDSLLGGAGNDTYFGGKDGDILDGEGGDDLLFGNLGGDTVRGGGGNDSMYGGKGNDNLLGDDGNDIIFGDKGADTMTGGAGVDTFVIPASQEGFDIITDYQPSLDQLQFAAGVDTIASAGNEFQNLGFTANDTVITNLTSGEVLVGLQNISLNNFTGENPPEPTPTPVPPPIDSRTINVESPTNSAEGEDGATSITPTQDWIGEPETIGNSNDGFGWRASVEVDSSDDSIIFNLTNDFDDLPEEIELSFEPGSPIGFSQSAYEFNESDGSFEIALLPVADRGLPTANLTILDDVFPNPTISIEDGTVSEADGSITLTVQLSEPTNQEVSINIDTEEDTADSDSDYENLSDFFEIPAFDTELQITLDITDDDESEETEQFLVNLSNPENATIEDGEAVVTITDND